MAITITTPVSYRVFQRSGTTGSIAITGTYTGSPTAIEASFNGGGYATIDASPAGGNYAGTLSGQAQGQGTLTVRFTNDNAQNASVTLIGIGDIYLIGGQSNACGETTANNEYYHPTLKAGLFGNDYNWKQLVDPSDSNAGQVDAVSSDTVGGSAWLPLATYLMAHENVPVAFVPCAKVGSVIADWQPAANHQDRTTLYGSMNYRGQQTGAKAVLFWQGESDSVNGTAEATYNSNLDTLANAVNTDLGVKLVVCKIFNLDQAPWTSDNTKVNNAINTAWGDNSNVIAGPDFSDLAMTHINGIHYGNDTVYLIASRWFQAIQAGFGWTPTNHYVQSNADWASSNTAVAFKKAVTAHNTIIVVVTQYGGTAIDLNSVSDGTNTYHLIGSVTAYSGDGNFRLGYYYAYDVAAGATTVTVTADGTPTVSIHEYSGLTTADPLDRQTTGQDTSGAVTSGNTANTTQADEIIFGVMAMYAGSNDFSQPGTDYTLREQWPQPTNQNCHMTEDRTVSSTGPYAATFTQGVDGGWIAKVATFKLAAVLSDLNVDVEPANAAYAVSSVKIVG